jgi:hypothetical protein
MESIEDLERRRSEELVGEGEGGAALERLIDEMADRQRVEAGLEPYELAEDEFACRACHLVFSRSCLVDHARVLCKDCAALAPTSDLRPREVPHVQRIHRPCPACGALVMVPEREEVSCGFVCPSCRVHLTMRAGHVHLVWNPRDAITEGVEP